MRKRAGIAGAVVVVACAAAAGPGCRGGDAAGGGAADAARRDTRPDAAPAANDLRAGRPDALGRDGSGPVAACAPLPAPTGPVVRVTPAEAARLPAIVAAARTGTTILLADGTYIMRGSETQRRLTFTTPGVTLRSASGDPAKVVIDGGYGTLEIAFIRADRVTLAELTLRRARHHLVHVTGSPAGHTRGTRLYRLRLLDAGQQFVKVNGDGKGHFADDGRLECSILEMTDAGRARVEPRFGGCYTGGIDAHGARGWRVALNSFRGIHCRNGKLAEHAVHFWSASRDTLVERNIIVDCARGVGFGLVASKTNTRRYADDPYPGVTTYIGHYGGIIRNNLIYARPQAAPYYDTGIELAQARGAKVFHNTVPTKPRFSSIDYRFTSTRVEIRNNLTVRITRRNGAAATLGENLTGTPASTFVDAAAGNFRLAPGATRAIDKGRRVPEAGLDLDGHPHDRGPPDLGAYERR